MARIQIYLDFGVVWQKERLEALERKALLPDEQQRAESFRLLERRHEYVLGRALMRKGFEALAPQGALWPVQRTPKGKPKVKIDAFPQLDFSIAHTQNGEKAMIACAINAHGGVGLDVEAVARAPSIDGVKSRVFSSQECAELSALDGAAYDARLLDIWTGKEAFTKAIGEGLGFEFSQFSLDFSSGEAKLGADTAIGEPDEWRLHYFNAGQHRFCCAYQSFDGKKADIDIQLIGADSL